MSGENQEEVRRQAEEAGKEAEEDTPAYQREEFPSGLTDQVKWYLLKGKTSKELTEEQYNNGKGYNPGTIRIAKNDLKKARLLEEAPKHVVKKPQTAVTRPETTGKIEVFSKGSPPEALINALEVPNVDGQLVGFEKGMKFGANLVVMGVRVAQELSTIGIQQAKPIMDMAKTMREGETLAARGAAAEAAAMAAGQVERNIAPYLAAMGKSAEGVNPMQGMMAKMFEPIMMNVMSKFIPGMTAPLAEGWKKRSE